MSPSKSLVYFISLSVFFSSIKIAYFQDPNVKAIAVLKGNLAGSAISGTVTFSQASATVPITVTVAIIGLPKGAGTKKHGLHVHAVGISDTSDNVTAICGSAGAHFNPLNRTHGDISAKERHVGDYGNILSDDDGNIKTEFQDTVSKINGPFGVIGRTIVLHQLEDDLGLKNDTGSKTTGNAGARIACGVIGISSTSTYYQDGRPKAIAVLKGNLAGQAITGTVSFTQASFTDPVSVSVAISGLPKGTGTNKHGLHVHVGAITDTSDNVTAICGSTGAHFNPLNKTHGDISAIERHIGDYGNILSDNDGNIKAAFQDTVSKLNGFFGVIGRTIVLHQLEDDLGLKNDTGSKTTGNAGARIACGVIGLSN